MKLLLSLTLLITISCSPEDERNLRSSSDQCSDKESASFENAISFEDVILPIFEDHRCTVCHINFKQEDTAEQLADKIVESVQMSPDAVGFMPTGDDPLPTDKISTLKDWSAEISSQDSNESEEEIEIDNDDESQVDEESEEQESDNNDSSNSSNTARNKNTCS